MDPLRPIFWSIVMAIVLVGVVLALSACATPEPPPIVTNAKPAFPDDMRLVCHEGTYYLGSVSADEIVRLPLSCM